MRTTRATAIAIAATAALSACGPQSQLRLNLRTVAVTVPRILAPALQLVPPSAPPPLALPSLPSPASQLPPPSTAQTVPSAAPVCPPASSLAVPKRPASTTVDTPPVSQQFTQRGSGEFQTASAKGSLAHPVQVTIVDLPATTSSNGQKVEPWQVWQVDAVAKTRSIEVYDLVLPSSAAGASPPGVYLVELAWTDPVRGTVTFQPAGNGLYILPSPVQVASNDAQYVGIATDPNTLTTLQLTRNVRGRKRVDVCGQLVDTWTVEMTGKLTSPSAQWNVTWNQQVATAYGAADVDELLGLDLPTGVSWTRRLVSTTVPEETR